MTPGSSSPLVTTAGSAAGAYGAAVRIHIGVGAEIDVSLRAILVGLAGALYTNVFEHAWHRYEVRISDYSVEIAEEIVTQTRARHPVKPRA